MVLGHITWAVMARREGLSILRSCYAFANENLHTPKKLWPSVKWELQTIAAILPLFRAHVNVGWSEDVAASDSSPFGYGICCRKLDPKTAGSIGAQSERWRYRFEDAADARKHAAKTAGVEELSKDVRSIIASQEQSQTTEQFIEGFGEVPIQVLHPDDWQIAWSMPWRFQDNILHTEALALCWSVEHALRANRNFGRRILFLSDNLPLTLGVCKGRAKSSFLTKPLRKICALSLATGSKFHVRWVPSEWNVADKPSRAISQWGGRGLEGWITDRSDRGPRRQRTEGYGGEKIEKTEKGNARDHSPRGVDIPGSPKCQAVNNSGLLKEVCRIPRLVEGSSDLDRFITGDGHCTDRATPRNVRHWARNQRRDQTGCSSEVSCSSFLHPTAPIKPISSRLASSSPTSAKDAHPHRGADGRDWSAPEPQCGGVRVEVVPAVFNIHETRGVQPVVSEAVGSTTSSLNPGIQVLGNSVASSRRTDSWEDGRLRRLNHSGLRFLDVSPPFKTSAGKEAKRQPLVEVTFRTSGAFQPSGRISQSAKTGSHPLRTEAWRGNPRRVVTAPIDVGGEAAREVEFGCVPETVCQRSQAPNRVGKGSPKCKDLRSSDPGRVTSFSHETQLGAEGTKWNSNVTHRMRQRGRQHRVGPKSLSGSSVLKKLFKDVSRKHRGSFHGVFLDIFSGDGSVAKFLTQNGFPVISIDINLDPRFDVLDPQVAKIILGWIRSRCVLGVWVATPNISWSRARHGPLGSSWDPMRTNSHIFGVPNLGVNDQEKVRIGNHTMKFTAQIITSCVHQRTPCFLENPNHSMMWLAPPIKHLCAHRVSRSFVCDFCQYGARWRKRTRIQSWFGCGDSDLSRQCSGHNGVCSRTHKHHIILKGQDPISKQLWTHLAQPYPKTFGAVAGKALVNSFQNMHTFHLKQVYGN